MKGFSHDATVSASRIAAAASDGGASSPGITNQQIMRTIETLNNLPSDIRRQAQEGRENGEEEKAERSEAWIQAQEAEIRERAMDLVREIRLGGHQQPSAELRALLRPMELPSDVFTGAQAENAEQPNDPTPAPTGHSEANTVEDPKKTRKHHSPDQCGAVVLGDAGHYVELRCDKCGGNAGSTTKKFLSGIRGFSKHYQAAHRETLSPAQILSRCFFRRVEIEEVRQIESGVVRIEKVHVAGSG